MDLKAFVIQSVPAEKYYADRFTNWNPTRRENVLCPWHDDTNPSLSVALKNGGAKCHACSEAAGNIVHFESKTQKISEEEAASQIYGDFIRPRIEENLVIKYHQNLKQDQKLLATVLKETGIGIEVIASLQIGWLADQKRLVFPVRDRWEQCVNLRLYKMPCHRRPTDEKMKVINQKGYGSVDLWPWQRFLDFQLEKPVFIMPSEKETTLMLQGGLQAVCATAGEMSWSEEWTPLFKDFEVCVVAQRDKTGRDAAAKKVAMLQNVTKRCETLEPPTDHKDLADWVVKDEGQVIEMLAQFKQHAHSAKAATFSSVAGNDPTSFSSETVPRLPELFSPEWVELSALGSRPEMLNSLVLTRGIIAAKATITYTIPWKFRIKLKHDTQREFALPMGRHLLSFVKASDKTVIATVQEMLGREEATVEPLEFVNVTEVEVIPMAAIDRDVVYVTQRCFFVGQRVDSNVPYEFKVVPTNAVSSQETIGIIVEAVPISRAVEARSFSSEELAALQIFRPADEESVMDKLEAMADQVSVHYSKIYNRPDWHIVALLSWLCPIGFAFPFEKEQQRGWLNTLAIGDTQTGKSKVIQTLQRLFNAGAIINAENCTYVGLVGGAIKMGSGQFMLRWGRIPLCDKQLVVIEELSGLSVEEIANMSDVRSSGIARLDKGGLSAETTARTRLLALSNVRPVNKTLAGYLSGVQAVRELVGHGEDIARFDLICTLVDREVSIDVINRPFSSKGLKDAIPESSFEKLCQFVWSLKPEQVKITTDAYYSCLDLTKKLSEQYHAGVPIFKGGSGRYKIARIAAAIAALQFSWNGRFLMVTEDHMEAAAELLEQLYDKPSFGYKEWSEQMFSRDGLQMVEQLNEKIMDKIPNVIKRSSVLEVLVHSAKFTRDELCAVASLPIMAADDLIGAMVRSRVLRKGEANTWEICPAGRDWMKERMKDDPIKA